MLKICWLRRMRTSNWSRKRVRGVVARGGSRRRRRARVREETSRIGGLQDALLYCIASARLHQPSRPSEIARYRLEIDNIIRLARREVVSQYLMVIPDGAPPTITPTAAPWSRYLQLPTIPSSPYRHHAAVVHSIFLGFGLLHLDHGIGGGR
ncbi:hypothetical protein GE09DRAFT_340783 [Coniochaeta sp. 2T2.1]|nr:hypothetical protein GE09DRAFT_340783 [Coniochaeta sp. 2T2.1]